MGDQCVVHIHAPTAVMRSVRWDVCPDCKKRSPFACLYYEWYGAESTCMRCGRHWSDGEWMPLDFCRDSRASSRRAARSAWKRAAIRAALSAVGAGNGEEK